MYEQDQDIRLNPEKCHNQEDPVIAHNEEAAAALKKAKEAFRCLFDAINDPVFLLEDGGIITDANKQVTEVLGYPRESLIGCSITCLLKESSIPQVKEAIESVSEMPPGQKFYTLDAFVVTKDKREIICELNLNRTTHGIQLQLSDVTEIRNMKRALEERSIELEKMLKNLEENNKKLKELDNLKSNFVSTVSHELRTPLTSIKGSLGLILNGVIGEINKEVREFLDICYRNTERLIRLVNNLLDIQKIEAGKLQLNKERTDLVKLVEDSISSLNPFAKECNVTLAKETPDESYIYADKDRISQVLYNLISNGIKYSEGGRVTISVRDSGEAVKVTVSDTGIGIPGNKLEQVFERFTRIYTENHCKKKGTGLGLSICKAIINDHNGIIWVESEEGKGCRFYFTLPKGTDSISSQNG